MRNQLKKLKIIKLKKTDVFVYLEDQKRLPFYLVDHQMKQFFVWIFKISLSKAYYLSNETIAK